MCDSMDSSPKNKNSVIIYSPSSSSKPVWISLFCRTQRKIFWRKFVTRTWRTPMSFVKQQALFHKHVMNERTELALSAHREIWMDWLCSSPPYDLAVPVPLLLVATEIAGHCTWIWRMGWRWARPISTCIPQI